MCAYFNTILKASKEYTTDWWRLYDFQYRQQAAATHNRLVCHRLISIQPLLYWPCQESTKL